MNIPSTNIDSASKIMVVGVGSGFDVFAGLPIVLHHRFTPEHRKEKKFVLVNSSPKNDFLYRLTGENDYPEAHIPEIPNVLAKYTVGRHGCHSTKNAYSAIAKEHDIDCILAVDGGVDALSCGDEQDSGTILEDFIALAALKSLEVKKVMCCLGFGTETEENLNHYRTLENMASFAKEGGFLGTFSLTREMEEFQQYKKICEDTWVYGRKSHIHTKIISAVEGNFKNQYKNIDPLLANMTGTADFISLLSAAYWFFDFDVVISKNKAIKTIERSNTFADAQILLRNFLEQQKLRDHKPLPL